MATGVEDSGGEVVALEAGEAPGAAGLAVAAVVGAGAPGRWDAVPTICCVPGLPQSLIQVCHAVSLPYYALGLVRRMLGPLRRL